MIDLDSSYLPLGGNKADRQVRYRLFVEQGVPNSEQKFLGETYQRNQLPGHTCFVDEVERRTGVSSERRARGRPKREKNRCVPFFVLVTMLMIGDSVSREFFTEESYVRSGHVLGR